MNKQSINLNIRYSLYQFGYWVDYLIIASFGAVLLKARGFEPGEIGYVTTIGAVLTIVLQTGLSSLADSSEHITVKQILLALMLGGAAMAAVLWLVPKVYAVSFVCMFTALALVNTMQPLMTSLCLQYNAAGHRMNFGIARSLGSLGYALAGFAMGWFTEVLGTEAILPAFSGIFIALMILVALMRKPEPMQAGKAGGVSAESGEKPSSLIQFFRQYKRYDLFLAGVVLMFFMQMITNTFMIYFVEHFGGGQSDLGLVLSVCAFAEMPAVAFSSQLMKRFSPANMLRISSLGGLLKFALMLVIPDVRWLIGIQVLQFFFSGFYMVSSVYYVDSLVSKKDAVKAQGIMAVGITGISGIAANLFGGWMLDHMPVGTLMAVGVSASLIGAVLIFAATGKHSRSSKEHRVNTDVTISAMGISQCGS